MRRLVPLLCNNIRIVKLLIIFILVQLLIIVLHQNSSTLSKLEYTNKCSNYESRVISTCSCTADQRGPNQSVVAYSLYGPYSTDPDVFSRYVSPIKENVAKIKKVYKGNNII